MSASHFRELEVWKAAMELAKSTYEISARFPAEERYGLTRQLLRAAVSIPSNIAEGNARQSRADYARFVSIASGSTAELLTQLQLAVELGLAEDGQVEPVRDLAESVGRMLYRLHKALLRQVPPRSPVPGPRSPDPEFLEGV
ncbi:MAG: four helix bundle protein [Xanthomonadales bacterium]|nr:four helix bundle protein [Xanthomonadales bacterium]